ncbi:MAG: hypothetical protein LV468_01125, partial [Candidatus Nitrosotenuis sp.]|nr:hypothetical protein [Candidatus Nitrosotenuis sp.]
GKEQEEKPMPQDEQDDPIHIPTWIRSNAKWWSEGTISDSDFVSGIQYLIQNGIMTVGQSASTSSGPADITDDQPEPASTQQNFVRVDADTVEKQAYRSTQVQITGKIEDFTSGTSVILTVVKPDGTSFDLKGIVTNRGLFTVPLMIDGNSQIGKYVIRATYNNYDVGVTSFTVE